MVSNGKYVCVPCRNAFKGVYKCPDCGEEMRYMGKHWRAPRKKNVKAWRRIAKGEVLWEDTYSTNRYVRVFNTFQRHTYNYLHPTSSRGRGSMLDLPETKKEPKGL